MNRNPSVNGEADVGQRRVSRAQREIWVVPREISLPSHFVDGRFLLISYREIYLAVEKRHECRGTGKFGGTNAG